MALWLSDQNVGIASIVESWSVSINAEALMQHDWHPRLVSLEEPSAPGKLDSAVAVGKSHTQSPKAFEECIPGQQIHLECGEILLHTAKFARRNIPTVLKNHLLTKYCSNGGSILPTSHRCTLVFQCKKLPCLHTQSPRFLVGACVVLSNDPGVGQLP